MAYSSQQNRVAKKKNRIVINLVKSIFSGKKILKTF